MTRYSINPGLVYQQGNQLPVTLATESTNSDPIISVLVRDFSNEVNRVHEISRLSLIFFSDHNK